MNRINFPSGNTYAYLQDFAVRTGIPSGVVFDVEVLPPRTGELRGYRVKLTALGYGCTPEYGNGAIYLSENSFRQAAKYSCGTCSGSGAIDSGAPDPQGHFIEIACPDCEGAGLLPMYD